MNTPLLVPLVVVGLLILLFVVEKFRPLRRLRAGLLMRLLVNSGLSALSFATAALVVQPAAVRALGWTTTQSFGLVHLAPLPSWAQVAAGFLLLDLSFYYWHIANHKIPWLWRFHNVHHIDPDLDVSTGFRFHFGEVLFSALFRVVQVSLIGLSMTAFAAYEVVFQCNTLFHHSNLRLPIRLERWLNKLLVTPRMHGVHHSQVRRELNSNFGVVFPWWDRLHRTLGLNIAQTKIEIGVPGYSLPHDNRFWHSLVMPFVKQRDYWRRPDGSTPERPEADMQGKPAQLAE